MICFFGVSFVFLLISISSTFFFSSSSTFSVYSCSVNNANSDKNKFDIFYRTDCCAAIHGRMNNVPNESRTILCYHPLKLVLLYQTRFSFIFFLLFFLLTLYANFLLLFLLTLYANFLLFFLLTLYANCLILYTPISFWKLRLLLPYIFIFLFLFPYYPGLLLCVSCYLTLKVKLLFLMLRSKQAYGFDSLPTNHCLMQEVEL